MNMTVPDILELARADSDDRNKLTSQRLTDSELELKDRLREMEFTEWLTRFSDAKDPRSSPPPQDVLDAAWTLAMHAESIDLQRQVPVPPTAS
jgi:hypothetical protein